MKFRVLVAWRHNTWTIITKTDSKGFHPVLFCCVDCQTWFHLCVYRLRVPWFGNRSSAEEMRPPTPAQPPPSKRCERGQRPPVAARCVGPLALPSRVTYSVLGRAPGGQAVSRWSSLAVSKSRVITPTSRRMTWREPCSPASCCVRLL